MAILVNNFDVNITEPLDSRLVRQSLSAMNSLAFKYEGLLSYNKSDKKFYFYDGTKFDKLVIDIDPEEIKRNLQGNPNFVAKFNSTWSAINSSIHITELTNTINGFNAKPSRVGINIKNENCLLSIGNGLNNSYPLNFDAFNEGSRSGWGIGVNWNYNFSTPKDIVQATESSVIKLYKDGGMSIESRKKNAPINDSGYTKILDIKDDKLTTRTDTITNNISEMKNIFLFIAPNGSADPNPNVINRFNITNSNLNINEISAYKSIDSIRPSFRKGIIKNEALFDANGNYKTSYYNEFDMYVEDTFGANNLRTKIIGSKTKPILYLDNDSKVGINTTTPTRQVQVDITNVGDKKNCGILINLKDYVNTTTSYVNQTFGLNLKGKDDKGYSIGQNFTTNDFEIKTLDSHLSTAHNKKLNIIRLKQDNGLHLDSLPSVLETQIRNRPNEARDLKLAFIDDLEESKVKTISIDELFKNNSMIVSQNNPGIITPSMLNSLNNANKIRGYNLHQLDFLVNNNIINYISAGSFRQVQSKFNYYNSETANYIQDYNECTFKNSNVESNNEGLFFESTVIEFKFNEPIFENARYIIAWATNRILEEGSLLLWNYFPKLLVDTYLIIDSKTIAIRFYPGESLWNSAHATTYAYECNLNLQVF